MKCTCTCTRTCSNATAVICNGSFRKCRYTLWGGPNFVKQLSKLNICVWQLCTPDCSRCDTCMYTETLQQQALSTLELILRSALHHVYTTVYKSSSSLYIHTLRVLILIEYIASAYTHCITAIITRAIACARQYVLHCNIRYAHCSVAHTARQAYTLCTLQL